MGKISPTKKFSPHRVDENYARKNDFEKFVFELETIVCFEKLVFPKNGVKKSTKEGEIEKKSRAQSCRKLKSVY